MQPQFSAVWTRSGLGRAGRKEERSEKGNEVLLREILILLRPRVGVGGDAVRKDRERESDSRFCCVDFGPTNAEQPRNKT